MTELKPCSLGVGCDEYGVCYAEAHDRPDMCPRTQPATSLYHPGPADLRALASSRETTSPPATQADALVDIAAIVRRMVHAHADLAACKWLPLAEDVARATLPIIQRETAAAHAAGVASTFDQRARDLTDAHAAGRAERQAEVVAWLREAGSDYDASDYEQGLILNALLHCADAIERGEHKEQGR